MSIFQFSRNSNGHISVARDATVTRFGTMAVLYTYCVCWCDLDPIQCHGQGHGAVEFPTISEAVHAGGDDRSPLAGLSDTVGAYS